MSSLLFGNDKITRWHTSVVLSAESVIGRPESGSIGGLISNAQSMFMTFKAYGLKSRSLKSVLIEIGSTHDGIACKRGSWTYSLVPTVS